MARKGQNLIGRRFGRVVVIERAVIPGVIVAWKYKCDCGKKKYSSTHNLISGNTISCGCSRKTHGLTKTRAYTSWKAMRYRCTKATGRHYHNYGGRGIKVCKRWEKFENFLADMGQPPKGMTLERINNNGNYTPSNCRWATYKEQLLNRRNSHNLTAFGKTQTLTQWAEEYGIPWWTIRHRVVRVGMSLEEALSAPAYYQQRKWRKSEKPISDGELRPN